MEETSFNSYSWCVDFVARLACVLTICNNLSPAPTFFFAYTNKVKVESISQGYLLSGVINCSTWFVYGSIVADPSIIFANGAAAILLMAYLFALNALNSHWRNALKFLYAFLVFLILLRVFGSASSLGQLGCALTFIQSFALASGLASALRHKDSKYINVTVTLMAALVQTVWAFYGYLIKDNYVFLPSLWGIFIAILQLLVYFWIVDVINLQRLKSVNDFWLLTKFKYGLTTSFNKIRTFPVILISSIVNFTKTKLLRPRYEKIRKLAIPHKKDDSEIVILKGRMERKKAEPASQTYGRVAGQLVSVKGKYCQIVPDAADIVSVDDNEEIEL